MKEKLFTVERVWEGKKVLYITNGTLEIHAGLDFGPRIFRMNLVGKDNVFFYDPSAFTSDKNEYRHYGGHRLWHTPEVTGVSSCPDNHPVEWSVEEDRITLTQVALTAPLRRSVTFRLDGNKVTVLHELTNVGYFAVETSCWALTQMAPDGYAVVPTSVAQTGLHPNRKLILWQYTDLKDDRLHFRNRSIAVELKGGVDRSLKVGTNDEAGFAAYFTKGGQLFVKKFLFDEEGEYCDCGCSFEVYENGDFLELESFSPLDIVEPGETLAHYEEWALYGEVETPNVSDEEAQFAVFESLGLLEE